MQKTSRGLYIVLSSYKNSSELCVSMWHPTVRDVLTAHDVVGEVSEVRSEGLKRSQEEALNSIRSVLDDARSEEDVYRAAAVYLKGLIDIHPFNDGNKRTAVIVTARFLSENGEVFVPRKVQNTEELYNDIKWELPSKDVEETALWLRGGDL